MGKRTGRLVLALVVVVALAASSASAFHGHPVYVANQTCHGHGLRPARFWIDCGPGAFYAAGLRYSSYGGRRAHAVGTLWFENCVPDCIDGAFEPYPVRVTLRRIINCGELYYYSVIRWAFTGPLPPGIATSGRHSIKPQTGPACP